MGTTVRGSYFPVHGSIKAICLNAKRLFHVCTSQNYPKVALRAPCAVIHWQSKIGTTPLSEPERPEGQLTVQSSRWTETALQYPETTVNW